MSDRVALQPMSMGALAIHDKQPRQDAERRFPRPARPSMTGSAGEPAMMEATNTAPASPAALEDVALPAETLFAATLLASDLASLPQSFTPRRSDDWAAPESLLRLRDRTI